MDHAMMIEHPDGTSGELEGDLLLVEDDDVDARTIVRLLSRLGSPSGLAIRRARSLSEALALIAEREPRVILADLTLPDAHHVEAVEKLAQAAPTTPIIVQTGVDDDRTPIETIRLGAQDYLVKGTITADALSRSLRYAVTRQELFTNLTRTENALDRANMELEDVVAMFAHDLKASVRKACLFGEIMREHLPPGNLRFLECADRLSTALDRLDSVILSMLDYDALLHDPPLRQPVGLRALVDDALDAVATDLLVAEAAVDVAIDADVHVVADAGLLNQVLVHLVTNSIKYRRPEVPLEIGISATADQAQVTIRVADNGKGVDPADNERVFRVMQRLDSETSGLGFGLSVCRRIIEGLDGRITLQSAGPGGATITIVLGVAEGPEPVVVGVGAGSSIDGETGVP